MKRLLVIAFMLTGIGSNLAWAQVQTTFAGPVRSEYFIDSALIGYGFVANIDRYDTGPVLDPWTTGLVAGQFNATAKWGVNQWVFGVAAEAWADHGSFSMLVGGEFSVLNRNVDNPWRKWGTLITFKNRTDFEWDYPPPDPANLGSEAIHIGSQPKTGFERGIVFDTYSLHASSNVSRPIVIDLSAIPDDQIGQIDLIKIRTGVSLRYDPTTQSLVLHKE
jgi:hypothetical protein